MRRSIHLRAPSVLLLLALAGSGCGNRGSALLDPVSQLDCRTLFPELEKDKYRPEPDQSSPFAKDFVHRAGWPASSESSAPHKHLFLAGNFVGELPGEKEADRTWQSVFSRDVTLLIQSRRGHSPNVMVYAETFSPWVVTSPREELMRFELTVDPGLLDEQLTWPAAVTAWVDPLSGSPSEKYGMRRLAWMAATRTGGRGLGYISSPHTFTGWKWMGRNRHGVLLRLARSQGKWGRQKPLDPELEKLLPRIIQRFPRLSWLAAPRQADPMTPSSTAHGIIPASMILGTATTPEGGIHLAVLCAQTPVCASAEDLARILSSLRPAGPGEIDQLLESMETGSNLEAFAADLDLVLAPQNGTQEAPRL